MKTLASLAPGQKATIASIADHHLSLKFLEMGCLPGGEVEYRSKAPLGSPICIKVLDYHLALRIEEAALIEITEPICPVNQVRL